MSESRDVPADDLPAHVAQRKPANLKPSVDAVKTPDARVEIVWLARRNPSGKEVDDMRQIVDMNGPVRAPLFHVVQSLTAVLDQLLVDEFNLTGRCQAGDHAGNGLHDQARLALAFLKILVKASVLQGDGRVRREHLEERHPVRREDPGSQVVLEIDDSRPAWFV